MLTGWRRVRTGIFLLVMHSYRLRSTTGPLTWKSGVENENNTSPLNHTNVNISYQSHLSRIAGPADRAVGELSEQAEHTRSMLSALSLSSATSKQELDE